MAKSRSRQGTIRSTAQMKRAASRAEVMALTNPRTSRVRGGRRLDQLVAEAEVI